MNMNEVPVCDMSVLPVEYRQNWHIYNIIREDSRVAFAANYAREEEIKGKDWITSFDYASNLWLEKNKGDPMWDGKWPVGAACFLGNEACADARNIMAGAGK